MRERSFGFAAGRDSAQMSRCAQNEAQNLGHYAIKLLRNLFIKLKRGQRLSELGILFQRHTMLPRNVDNFLAEPATPDCHHAWCSILAFVVSQCDGERFMGQLAHDARSRNCPARATRRCGAPKQKATSGTTSESLSAWLS